MAEFQIPHPERKDGAPLHTAILFVDLIDSSLFASILSLEEYANYVQSFSTICERQIRYFFETFLEAKYKLGLDYHFRHVGDELRIFLHAANHPNDVYLLTILAITLKCAWLAAPLNLQRLHRQIPTCDVAIGVHFGSVWAQKRDEQYKLTGYAINLAKRIETFSRGGERFNIFLSDSAFKQINLRMRNLLFGRRELIQVKGILGSVGVYELHDSFVDPMPRLEPNLAHAFQEQMEPAFRSNSRDLWIHSCLQVSYETALGHVTDAHVRLCQEVLAVDNQNPVALYYLAQGYRERNSWDKARLLLEDLVRFWPSFGDGWLEYGRALSVAGLDERAERAFIKANLQGVSDEEVATQRSLVSTSTADNVAAPSRGES